MNKAKRYSKTIKPLFDIVGALVLLCLFSPLVLIVASLLWYDLGENPFFRQVRPGKNQRLFSIIKLKTMRSSKNSEGQLLSDNERLTVLGGYVRKLSIDELPQLLNVIKGDMSFVGPRPLLVEYLPLYSNQQKRRHEVKPGITGWAQINGRNAISWSEKFELDVWYVENQSFSLDIKILWLTALKVVKREGVNQTKNITMEAFTGEN